MTGCAMKSEAIGTDRIKTEGRQSIHRWRMSKIPPIVNGAEDNVGYADGEEIMVRQANPVNLAAAVHDHISCTKSAELRKVPETKDGRVNLPLTDHMYANYSEKPKGLGMITTVSPIPPDIKDHVRCLEEIVIGQLNLIGKQNEKICHYEKRIEELGKELKEGTFGQVLFRSKSETAKSGQEVSHKLNTVKAEQEVSCKLNSVKSEFEVSHKLSTVQSGLAVLPSVRWDQNFGFDLTCSQSGECKTNLDWRCSVLSKRVGERDDKMCVVKNEEPANGNSDGVLEVANNVSNATPQSSMSYPTMEKRLLTKCCGRTTSKHPSRSLKRRNMVLPDKSSSSRRQIPYLSPSKPSISPSHAKRKSEEKTLETDTLSVTKIQPVSIQPVTINFKKPHKKRGRKSRGTTWKDDYLHTDKPYFLPDYYNDNSPLSNAETTIDGGRKKCLSCSIWITVPSWRLRVYQSGFRIEKTENIDDHVFEQRHYKYEKEEKRRKKLDLQQQQREVDAVQKLNRKQCRGLTKDSQGKLRRRSGKLKKSISLYPSPKDIEYIEVTDSLPVIAFGHLIPVFQPSEFSLPWSITDPFKTTESPGKLKQIGTSTCGQKVT